MIRQFFSSTVCTEVGICVLPYEALHNPSELSLQLPRLL